MVTLLGMRAASREHRPQSPFPIATHLAAFCTVSWYIASRSKPLLKATAVSAPPDEPAVLVPAGQQRAGRHQTAASAGMRNTQKQRATSG